MKRFASAGARARRGAGLLGKGAAALGAALLANCLLVVDREADQCSSDGDCTGRGSEFAGFRCDAAQRLCVDPRASNRFIDRPCTIDANCRAESAPVGAFDAVCGDEGLCVYQGPPATRCRSNLECTQQAEGRISLCRPSDGRCVEVTSQDCEPGEPLEAFRDPNAVVFGTLLTNKGDYVASGLPLQQAVALAVRQIQDNVRGLPGGPNNTRRQMAFVFCHEGEDVVRAARHLTDTLRVPAIIGASISDFTIAASSDVTVPSGVLLISPGATSISITNARDKGLLWRTAPSDVVQSAALAQLGQELEDDIKERARQAVPPVTLDKVKVALVVGDDAYGQNLAADLRSRLRINGGPLSDPTFNNSGVFRSWIIDFNDPGADATILTANDEIVAFAPHLTVLVGSSDVVTKIMTPVDARLTEFPPYYLVADGAFGSELSEELGAGETRLLRQRLRITAPGAAGENFNSYLANFSQRFRDSDGTVFGAAGAYDATYLLALATSSLAPEDVTGANLAAALGKTADVQAPPDRVFDVVLANNVDKYLTVMAEGGTVNFNGASGPLDFDTATGEASADIQIFCADAPVGGASPQLRRSGRYYDAIAKTVLGTDTCEPLEEPTPPTAQAAP